ncbi:MAG: sensor histidine kinase [Devosia sp.]
MTSVGRRRGSLRVNLMAWLIVPVVVILAASAWLSYDGAMQSATLVTDHQLIGSARMMAEEISYDSGQLSATIPPSALELFASDDHDEVAYAIVGANDELIAGYPGLDGPKSGAADADALYYQTMFRDEYMRVTQLSQPVMTPQGALSVTVRVGETLKARNDLVLSLWLRGFIEQALLVLAAFASIWIGINRELTPLLNLRQAVLGRPADRFEPFDAASVQSEVRPLVLALNSHMERLKLQLERQTRFLDSAAHQLRTPLAIMKTQIGYARRTREPAEIGAALSGVDGSLTAMARLTNQLLTLGKVEHDGGGVQPETVDLDAVARRVVAEAAPRALDQHVELVLESAATCPALATEILVHEVLNNLVDNAIAHAGPGAVAIMSVRRVADWAEIRVEDNGAGVDVEDRAKLFDRFHRGPGASEGGSGLGLSIVAEIAQMLGGSVDLPAPSNGRGFCAVVRLKPAPVVPASQPATTAENVRSATG